MGVVNLGHDGVTVVHGSVREFAFGVRSPGRARHIRFLGISTSRNGFFGIADLRRRPKRDPKRFLQPQRPPGGRRDRRLRLSPRPDRAQQDPTQRQAGIHVADSNENLIKRNVFSRNSPGIL